MIGLCKVFGNMDLSITDQRSRHGKLQLVDRNDWVMSQNVIQLIMTSDYR